MTEDEEIRIRKRYERDGGPKGANHEAVSQFINMLRKHEQSDNSNVRRIVAGLGNLEHIAPNFTIFQSDKIAGFMHQFNALSITLQMDQLVISHEFGHAILGMVNGLKIPEEFEKVVARAYSRSKSPENIDKLREYIKRISNSDSTERTEAEKGPVSDIISAIHQYSSFKINGQVYILPSFHLRSYYYDDTMCQMKTKQIFDECFANFYALISNNCHEELEKLKMLFGEEFFSVMDAELEKAAITINKEIEKKEDSLEDPVLE